jgi:PAS domain S-box-containing protein
MLLLKPNLERLALAAGLSVLLIGILVLAGWWLHVDVFIRVMPDWPAMYARTAFMLALAGAALALTAGARERTRRRRLAAGVSVLVGGLALLNALDALFGWEIAGEPPSLPTSSTMLMLASAMALLGRKRNISEPLVLAGLSVPILAVLGYLFGVPALYSLSELRPYTGMAVHTAFALLFLGGGTLCARPEGRIISLLAGRHAGGHASRLLLFLLLVLPVAAIPITAGVRAGWYPVEVAAAILVFVAMAIGLVLIVTAGWRLEETDIKLIRIARLVESSGDAIVSKSLDGTILDWNRGAENLYGYTAEEIVGRSILELVPRERPEEMEEIIARARSGAPAGTREAIRVRKDGTRVTVAVTDSPILEIDGSVVGASSIARDISAEKRLEAALRESEERFRRLFEQASDGIFIADLDGRYTAVNEAGCRMLGYGREELVGRTILDLIPAEDVPRFMSSKTLLFAGQTHVAEWRLRKKDGALLPVEVSAKILPDGRWQGFVRDISERKEAELALRTAAATEQRLRRELEEVARAATAVTEAVADLPRSNLAAVLHTLALQARAITGAQYAALGVGLDPLEPFDPWVQVGMSEEVVGRIGRAPRPIGTLGRVARDDRTVRLRDVRRHSSFGGFPPHHPEMTSFLGVPIRFHSRAVGNIYLANKQGGEEFTAQDERLMLLLAARAGVAIEIASLYAGEAVQRAWQQAILDQMPEGVIIVSEQGTAVTQNVMAQSLASETQRTDARGAHVTHDLRYPSGAPVPAEDHPIERAFAHGETVSGVELLIVGPEGQLVPVLVSATPVLVGGRRTGAVLVFQDIRTLKELEQLREEWTAVVAHDLRQPVSGIAMSADLLARVHALGQYEKEPVYLERIKYGARRLENMIRDLLDASRIEARRLSVEATTFDLGRSIEQCCPEVHELEEREVVLELPAERVLVNADPARVEQILANLLSNASKYGDPGSPIQVSLAVRDAQAEVVVTNRGVGLAPEEIAGLFQRFSRKGAAARRGVEGIGLGLYITRGLVEANGGRIWVESRPGETTSFHFTLPLAEAQAVAPPPA